MNKLEVGMYVRTENGIIEKINQIYDRHTTDNIVVWLNGYGDGKSVFIDDFEEIKFQSINSRGFIKKEPSFDIIDLIEEGDFVNGMQVEMFYDTFNVNTKEYEDVLGFPIYDDALMDCVEEVRPLKTIEIKSIVTKEAFQNAEYRVETN